MSLREIAIFALLCVIVSISSAPTVAGELDPPKGSYKPETGFVPDEVTAIRVAEAILIPIYGESVIKWQRPFKAVLNNGIWTVKGQLEVPKYVGGVATVKLSKSDARIFWVRHTR